eukprot:m.211147 g.211147  ORF g.211147 m.211147 type:complete len:1200 (+) comp15832_c0_seq11:240-3839(+)
MEFYPPTGTDSVLYQTDEENESETEVFKVHSPVDFTSRHNTPSPTFPLDRTEAELLKTLAAKKIAEAERGGHLTNDESLRDALTAALGALTLERTQREAIETSVQRLHNENVRLRASVSMIPELEEELKRRDEIAESSRKYSEVFGTALLDEQGELDASYHKSQEEVRQLQTQLVQMRGSQRELLEAFKEASEREKDLIHKLEVSHMKQENMQAEMSALRDATNEAQAHWTHLESKHEAVLTRCELLEDQLNEMTQINEELESGVMDAREIATEKEKELTEARGEVELLSSKLEDMEDVIEGQNVTRNALEASLVKLKEIQTKEHEGLPNATLVAQFAIVREQLTTLANQTLKRSDLESEISNTLNRFQNTQSSHLKVQIEAIKSDLEALFNRANDQNSNRILLNEAVQTCLGTMQDSLVRKMEISEQSINVLSTKADSTQEEILLIKKILYKQNEEKDATSEIKKLADERNCLQWFLHNAMNNYLSTKGSLEVARVALETNTAKQAKEVATLMSKMSCMQLQRDQACQFFHTFRRTFENRCDSLYAEVDKRLCYQNKALSCFGSKFHEISELINNLKAEKKRLTTKLQESKESERMLFSELKSDGIKDGIVEQLKVTVDNLMREKEDIKRERDISQNLLTSLQKEKEKLQEWVDVERKTCTTLRKQLADAREQLSAMQTNSQAEAGKQQTRIVELECRVKQAEFSLDTKLKAMNEMQENLLSLKSNSTELDEKNKYLHESIVSLREFNHGLERDKTNLSDQITKLRQQTSELQHDNKQLLQEQSRLQAQVLSERDKYGLCQELLNTRQQTLAELQSKLTNQLGATIPTKKSLTVMEGSEKHKQQLATLQEDFGLLTEKHQRVKEELQKEKEHSVDLKQRVDELVESRKVSISVKDNCEEEVYVYASNNQDTQQRLTSKITRLELQLDTILNAFQDLKSKYESASNLKETLEHQVKNLEVKVTDANQLCEQLQVQKDEDNKQMGLLLTRANVAGMECSKLEGQVSSLRSKLEECKQTIQSDSQKISNLENLLCTSRKELEDNRDKFEAHLQRMQQEHKRQVEELQTKLQSLRAQLETQEQGERSRCQLEGTSPKLSPEDDSMIFLENSLSKLIDATSENCLEKVEVQLRGLEKLHSKMKYLESLLQKKLHDCDAARSYWLNSEAQVVFVEKDTVWESRATLAAALSSLSLLLQEYVNYS